MAPNHEHDKGNEDRVHGADHGVDEAGYVIVLLPLLCRNEAVHQHKSEDRRNQRRADDDDGLKDGAHSAHSSIVARDIIRRQIRCCEVPVNSTPSLSAAAALLLLLVSCGGTTPATSGGSSAVGSPTTASV